jgi:anti-anti-sigma factor
VIDPATTSESVSNRPASLRLSGEVDSAVAPAIRHQLCSPAGDVELDCSGLTFIDASGLSLFVAVHRACEGRGAKLVLVNPARCVTRLLALMGVDAALTVRRVSSTR